MIELVISGGQTGADQAGWRAAKAAGIPTGGWMPRGFLTEDGPQPEMIARFYAMEHGEPGYPPRTRRNVAWGDVTLWFGNTVSPGFSCTLKACRDHDKPMWCTRSPEDRKPRVIVTLLERFSDSLIRETRTLESGLVLNVAGNRESTSPGIGAWVEAYLAELFRITNGK